MRASRIAIIITLACVAAIGGVSRAIDANGEDFAPEAAPVAVQRSQVVILGNSMTMHGPKASLGWTGNYGMAAPSRDLDYSHLLIAALNVPESNAYIRNVYPFETDDTGARRAIDSVESKLAQRPDITVLELGDNVKAWEIYPVVRFQRNFGRLAQVAGEKSKRLYCLSTYWHSRVVDFVIKRECEAAGGTYVFIGDVASDPNNPDRTSHAYANAGVNKHPQEYGMAAIARRLQEKIGTLAVAQSTER
ncbi:MAG TPA: hypothetical protein VF534_01200 [Paraburkholderia sp.]